MKQYLIKIYQDTVKSIKRMSTSELLMWMFVFLFLLDISYSAYRIHAFKNAPEQQEFKKISNYIQTAEHNKSIEEVSVSKFLKEISAENEIYFTLGGKGVTAIVSIKGEQVSVVKKLPSSGTVSSVESKLIEKDIAYEWLLQNEKPKSFTTKILDSKLISILFLIFMGYVLLMISGITLFSKEHTALYPDTIEGSLDDLIGYEDIKQESRQLMEIITQNSRYSEYGIDGTFNILFSGRAGTGKSKFALLLAKELDIPIVATTGSLDEVYVGSGAKKIRTLFKNAQNAAAKSEHGSAIVFIDEAQKMLRKRGAKNDEKWSDDTANELLAYLDGVQSSPKYNIIVIMASNFDENSFEMDEAMLRRFRKKIHFREPNLDERKEILKHYLEDITQKEEDIDVAYIAKNMSGMTPAIIESIVNESALLALRTEAKVGTDVLLKAFERVIVGKSSRALTQGEDKVRRTIAVHEIGHFLVEYHRALVLSEGDMEKAKELTRIMKISSESIAQIGALGFAVREQDEGMMLKSVGEIEWEIKQLYGGIAAEQMVYGKNGHTTGGADDIKRATKLLQYLIVENSVYSASKLNYELLNAKEKQIKEIEVKSKIFYEESLRIVEEHEGLLLYLSGVLMAEWSLSKERLFELIENFYAKKQALNDATEYGFGFYEEESIAKNSFATL